MNTVITNQLILEEVKSDQNQKAANLAQSIALMNYASVVTHHLAATSGANEGNKVAAVGSDPWSGFNWPVAPSGSGSSINSDPNGSPVDPFSGGNADGGYLQQFSQILQELQQNPTDLNLLPTLIEFLSKIGNSPLANDPDFLKLMQAFPLGADGKPDLSGFAQIIVLMEFNRDNGDTSKVSSFISSLIDAVGQNNPIMGSFVSQLQSLQGNLGQLTKDYMQGGSLGYMDSDDLFGDSGQYVQCSQSQFYTYIGGLLGNDLVQPAWGGDPNQSFSSIVQAITTAEFEKIKEEMKHASSIGEALVLFMMLLGSSKDAMYQNQLNGLASTVQFLNGQTGQVNTLIGDVNSSTFSGGSGAGNAKGFFDSLIQLYESTKANPNATSLTSSLKSALSQIFNLKDSANGKTLLTDYQNGDFSDLAKQLATDCGNVSTGDGLTILNSIKQLSQSFTNQSQSVGTQIQATSSDDNQIVNFLKSFLTDSTSGITAAENAISTNQKTN